MTYGIRTAKQMQILMTVKTTRQNRDFVIAELEPFGKVIDRWFDGSFDFAPSNAPVHDVVCEILDTLEIEHRKA